MEELTITPNSTFQRNDADFLFTEVDDETVLMNIHDSGYIGLNDIATVIWKMLTSQKSLTSLVEDLVQLYEVEKEQCEKEVSIALKRMVRMKVLQLV